MEREKQKKMEKERMFQEKYMINQVPSREPTIPEVSVKPVQNLIQVSMFLFIIMNVQCYELNFF